MKREKTKTASPAPRKEYSANQIIGNLIAREKYAFVDGKLIASIVDDAVYFINDALRKAGK